MVNREKVILQTKVAVFEKHEKRKSLSVLRYTEVDYITFHALLVGVSVTLACLTMGVLYILTQLDAFATKVNLNEAIDIVKQMGLIYVIILVSYLVIALIVYIIRYKKALNRCRDYRSLLKKLNISLAKEERRNEKRD